MIQACGAFWPSGNRKLSLMNTAFASLVRRMRCCERCKRYIVTHRTDPNQRLCEGCRSGENQQGAEV